LGILLNELLTNVMKYAFTGREAGILSVGASRSDGSVTITIQDDGIGMPETVNFDSSPGFGLTLVGILAKQLKGTIRVDRNNGTKLTLVFEA